MPEDTIIKRVFALDAAHVIQIGAIAIPLAVLSISLYVTLRAELSQAQHDISSIKSTIGERREEERAFQREMRESLTAIQNLLTDVRIQVGGDKKRGGAP